MLARKMMFLLISTALLFSTEETQKKTKPLFEEKIEVIGQVPLNRCIQSVMVHDEEALRHLSHETLKGVLNATPGMLVLNAGHAGEFAYAFARGAAVNQMLYLVDGVRLFDPSSSLGGNFSALLVDLVERVEVVRGPLSHMYGSNAMGGVVNLVPRRNGSGASFSWGSHGTLETKAYFTRQLRHGFSLSCSGGLMSYSDGLANDRSLNRGLTFRLLRRTVHSSLGLTLFSDFLDTGIPLNLGQPSLHRQYWQSDVVAAIPLTFDLGRRANAEVNVSYQIHNYHFTDPDDTWNPEFSNRSRIGQLAARVVAHWRKGIQTTFGVEYSRQEIDNTANAVDSLKNASADSFSLLAVSMAEWRNLLGSFSLRLDRYHEFGSVLSPQLGISWNVLSALKLRGSYALSFRAPTLPETLNPLWGNPDLFPEKGKSAELGADVFWRTGFIGLTLFDSNYRNLIGFSPMTSRFANLDQARIRGVECQVQWQAPGNLSVALAYTYLNTYDVEYQRQLLRRPKHALSASLGWRSRHVSLFVRGMFVGRRLDYNEVLWTVNEVSSFDTYQANLEIPLAKGIMLQADMGNIFNRQYQEVLGYPAPGRRISIGISYQQTPEAGGE